MIETVHADNAVLRILPKKIGSDPLIFELYKLTLHSVGFDHPIEYDAKLKNAKPPGLIDAKGGFGPWQKINPANTPLSGEYKFQNADLSVFKGISGRLSSVGQFKGVLQSIVVNGTTDTPDFKVRLGNHPVDLKTEFHAVVDGTNGDTLLQPVTARFGKTTVICNGAVAKMGGRKGKTVVLDVRVDDGRIEDLMKFAVPSKPPLTGTIRFTAKLELPPGDQDVMEKLRLRWDIQRSKCRIHNSCSSGKSRRAQLAKPWAPRRFHERTNCIEHAGTFRASGCNPEPFHTYLRRAGGTSSVEREVLACRKKF